MDVFALQGVTRLIGLPNLAVLSSFCGSLEIWHRLVVLVWSSAMVAPLKNHKTPIIIIRTCECVLLYVLLQGDPNQWVD